MCGIAGCISLKGIVEAELRQRAMRMTNALAHRGPDDSGIWLDVESGIALGHRRLSIIDLSAMGHQPMVSHSGRYIISLNGEIYNFLELRKQIDEQRDGFSWRGRSDTEVVLESFDHWGIRKALDKFVGMFAMAVWDRRTCTLTLIRDRIGKKPLYYGWIRSSFIFCSELKALKSFPGFAGEIDTKALDLFFQHNYIPSPRSIYKGIYKLPAGCYLSIPLEKIKIAKFSPVQNHDHSSSISPLFYWSARSVVEKAAQRTPSFSYRDFATNLDRLIQVSVKRRMISDVPVGAFLSGGVDSSLITALMQRFSSSPIKTFTVRYDESSHDESEAARELSSLLGTEHQEFHLSSGTVLDVIPEVMDIIDEPLADVAMIPAYCISNLAGEYVKVVVTGDGGDELFAGYSRYIEGYYHQQSDWQQRLSWIPEMLRVLTHFGISRFLDNYSGTSILRNPLTRKIKAFNSLVGAVSPELLYAKKLYYWKRLQRQRYGAQRNTIGYAFEKKWADINDWYLRMLCFDLAKRLPDSLLAKVDRATMSVGLEARCPLLDHQLVKFAASVPTEFKIENNQGKKILREVQSKYLPKKFVDRRKKAFSLPISSWLRGPLREWAEDLLSPAALGQHGLLETTLIRRKWNEHVKGEKEWPYHIWSVLMFQGWWIRGRIR